MSIDLALEIAQHNAVTAYLPEAGEFGRIADLLKWPTPELRQQLVKPNYFK